MEKNKDILNQLKLRKKPSVPVGYFEQFWDDLSHEIEFDSSILGQLKKSEKPALPDNYFDSNDTSISLSDLKKNEKPELPDNFFANFEVDVKEETHIEKKKTNVVSLPFIKIFTAIAAALVLFLIAYNSNNDDNLSTTIASIEDTENYDDYLAYLEEDDIVEFIVDSQINLNENEDDSINYDTYSFFSEEDIEDYYLEL